MPTTNVLTQLVGIVFAALAAFHVALPSTFNQTSVAAAVLLVMAAVSAYVRFVRPGVTPADAKVWWQSKTIWTAFVSAVVAMLALFGVGGSLDTPTIVGAITTVAGIVNLVLHKTSTAALTAS